MRSCEINRILSGTTGWDRLFSVPDVPARRKPATPPELLSRVAAGPSCPEPQRVAASGAGRGAVEALLQIIDVLQVCGACLRQHPCFDDFHDPLHLSVGEEHLRLALYVTNVAARQDVRRHFGLQAAIAAKHDDGMHPLGRDASQI